MKRNIRRQSIYRGESTIGYQNSLKPRLTRFNRDLRISSFDAGRLPDDLIFYRRYDCGLAHWLHAIHVLETKRRWHVEPNGSGSWNAMRNQVRCSNMDLHVNSCVTIVMPVNPEKSQTLSHMCSRGSLQYLALKVYEWLVAWINEMKYNPHNYNNMIEST